MTDDTFLHRQVNPAWVQNGRATSQAFRPTPKDHFKLSVYDGDKISPERSWKHFTEMGKESAGVLSLAVQEFAAEGLPCLPSPEIFPEHAHVDFTGFTEKEMRGKGKRLRDVADARGWQYRV